MDIYIVLYETTDYYSERVHLSFESETSARSYAVSKANNSEQKLHSILKINTTNKKVTEYELTLVEGQFQLQQI